MAVPDNPQKPGGLWARLFGLDEAAKSTDADTQPGANGDDLLPVFDVQPPAAEATAVPLAVPVGTPAAAPVAFEVQPVVPVAVPVTSPPASPPPLAVPVRAAPAPAPSRPAAPPVTLPAEAPPAAGPQLCPSCQTPRKGTQAFCDDCGWMFGNTPPPSPVRSAGASVPFSSFTAEPVMPGKRIKQRFEIAQKISEKPGLCRYRGWDYGQGGQPVAVFIVEAPVLAMAEEITDTLPMLDLEAVEEEEIMPTFEAPLAVAGMPVGDAAWPSIAWEKALLEKASHPSLPAVIDHFVENDVEYLIEGCPEGRSLWDAWDEPEADAAARYGWLKNIAEGLQALHQGNAIIEGLRPDLVTVTQAGQAVIADLSDLLPLPLLPNPPIRATLYTAPELVLSPQEADARADLYSFGALLYSLEYLHHALEEKDFEHQFSPKLITDRYPDVHPLFFRLVSKTFVRDVNTRFPTDEASKTDPTGITELIAALEVCRRTFENVRLDIAAWTTTGMVRTGNEDAFAFMHAVESRQDDLHEYAMVLLADGMGGYEAGEVAAAMAIAKMRENLLTQPMFAALTGKEAPEQAVNIETCKQSLQAALKFANKEVYTAARAPGKGRRGMGCTAEAVYVDSANVIVGHVGDSRTYHLHQGRLVQLTRDQTLVNRLVELGQLTEAEAEDHPRKNELQQAIGGQPDVVPGLYHGKLKRGDWVLVCSDGLTNHIPKNDLEQMLSREAAGSAEEAARRLLNLVNLRGATDNATIVVIRAT
jgi:PPM family protein phosphatase